MITLPAAGTLAAVAGTATAITCTVMGMELSAGVEAYKVLFQGQLGVTMATKYTVPASTQAFIKSILLANVTGTAVAGVAFNTGGTAVGNRMSSTFTIPANGFASYTDAGWKIFDALGNRQFTFSGILKPFNGNASSTRLSYKFDTSTAAGPGSPNFRYSSADFGVSTDTISLYISSVDNNGKDQTAFFTQLIVSDAFNDLIVTVMTSTTDVTTRLRARVTAIVNNTTYFTLTCVVLDHYGPTLPTLSSVNIIQVDSNPYSGSAYPPLSLGNKLNGIPKFDVVAMATLALLLPTRMMLVPFWTPFAIFASTLCMITQTAATAGVNLRGGIYRAKQMPTAGPNLGAIVFQAAWTGGGTGTGLKNLTVNTLLPPGYYWLAVAFPVMTGSPALTALYGHYNGGINLNANQAAPTLNSAWAVTGTDFTAGLAAENTGINLLTAVAVPAAIGNSVPLPFWLEYRHAA